MKIDMLRIFDLIFAVIGLVILSPVLILIYFIGLFYSASPLFYQQRVGRNQKPFFLVKFRSMRPDTVSVATHLMDATAITPFGRLLRRTKLDELPQLWNVIKGEMSLVGPRPCLFNQTELIYERIRLGVFTARPGITGLAQIKKIDMSTPMLLAETDALMLECLNLSSYLKYILKTLLEHGSERGKS